MDSKFRDRREAGRALADRFNALLLESDFLILGLAPGGVPVAYEVARTLDLPVDVFVLRTLHVPRHEELTVGGIAAGGVRVLDGSTIAALGIPQGTIDEIARREALELARLEQYYRSRRQGPKITGRGVALIDDGLATASTLRTAVSALSVYRPSKIILAVPIAPPEVIELVDRSVDEVVYAVPPEPLEDIGLWYHDASPASDREIRQLLADAAEARRSYAALPEKLRRRDSALRSSDPPLGLDS